MAGTDVFKPNKPLPEALPGKPGKPYGDLVGRGRQRKSDPALFMQPGIKRIITEARAEIGFLLQRLFYRLPYRALPSLILTATTNLMFPSFVLLTELGICSILRQVFPQLVLEFPTTNLYLPITM